MINNCSPGEAELGTTSALWLLVLPELGHAKSNHGGQCYVALAITKPCQALLSHARPIHPKPIVPCQATLCRRQAGVGDVPPLAHGGAARPTAPGTGAHPQAGRSLRLGGCQLGLPRQAAGNGPGATGCGAAPAAAEQAQPAWQAAAAPETGSQAVPTAWDAGASTHGQAPLLGRSPSQHRLRSPLPAEVGVIGLGVIKPSGPWEPTGSDSPQWD